MNNISITYLLVNFSNWSECINSTIKKRNITIYDKEGNIYTLPNQHYIFKTIELCPLQVDYNSNISVNKILEIIFIVIICIGACISCTRCIIKYS